MFEGIKPKTLLSTHQEWHAFLIGYFESVCPWPALRPISEDDEDALKGEYHYYVAGRAGGFLALLFIIFALACLVKEVLL